MYIHVCLNMHTRATLCAHAAPRHLAARINALAYNALLQRLCVRTLADTPPQPRSAKYAASDPPQFEQRRHTETAQPYRENVRT